MKILALDIGDVWTGVAISDPLGIVARPYTTITSSTLVKSIEEIITQRKNFYGCCRISKNDARYRKRANEKNR